MLQESALGEKDFVGIMNIDGDEFYFSRFPRLILLPPRQEIIENSNFCDVLNNFQKVALCVFQVLIARLLGSDSGDNYMEDKVQAGSFQSNEG
jgi:hypothetical protein